MPERANPFGIADARLPKFLGKALTKDEWELLQEIVESVGLTRWQLAETLCENLEWLRPNGKPKTRECFEFLGKLAECGVLPIPELQERKHQPRARFAEAPSEERPVREGTLRDFLPVEIELARNAAERKLWREQVARHHYLGEAVPFGARLRYLIWISKPERELAGCLQFSSAAWKLESRDGWLGWDAATRTTNLPKVVNNSRFLILPWIRIKGLASHVLSRSASILVDDWEEAYAVRPVLLETFVEKDRFDGTCYKAANWIAIGETAGRGRQDRYTTANEPVKTCLVRPLASDYRRQLGAAV
jgi:hypothetical protein